MSCFTQLGETHQLQCNFPELTGTLSIAVYFTSTDGTERRVSDCVLFDDLDCNNENGFKCEKLSSDHAEFTVPEYFDGESGSFRCQTPGLTTANIVSCPWPPAGTGIYHSPGDVINVKASSGVLTRLSANGEASTPADGSTLTSGGIAGVVLGCLFFIAVFLAIAFLVWRRLSQYKKQTKYGPVSTHNHNADNFACTSDKGISSSKSKQSSERILSNDSGNDTIQFNYPAQPETNYFKECEKRKQHLLNKPLREHQVGDDLVDPSNKSTSSSKEKQWIELFPLNDSGKDRIQDDKDERENQRNGSCGDSPDDLNNDDLSLAKSPNLKLSVEQDKKEFSGDIDKASSLRRRRLHSDSEYPRDSERNRESFALRSLPVD